MMGINRKSFRKIFENRQKLILYGMALLNGFMFAVWNFFGKSAWFVLIFRGLLVRRFNLLYYYLRGTTFDSTYFMGKHVLKFPTDLWIYQEIVFEKKPTVIIETGVFLGGSTLYYAKLLDLVGGGRVIGVDVTLDHADPDLKNLQNVTLIEGDSLSADVYARVKELIGEEDRVMVILDSDHAFQHVHAEMLLYSKLVSDGQYLIVEDGIIDSAYPWPFNSGPMKAIRKFMQDSSGFQVDIEKNRFLLTQNPSGYLYKGVLEVSLHSRDFLRPLKLWLPFGPVPGKMKWFAKLNQSKRPL